MKRYIFNILFAGIIFIVGYGNIMAQTSPPSYEWKPLKIGGGGFVVGMDVHPTEPNLIYVRTDVSGAYRWDVSLSTWVQLVTAQSLPSDFTGYALYGGVSSLVGAPSNPDIDYMAFRGEIFKSNDRGTTWQHTWFMNIGVVMEGNGAGRLEGERLAVDPNNSNVVYFGSIKRGLWSTKDGGNTWNRINAIPAGTLEHGVNTVVFDKNSGITNSKTNVIYVTVDNGGVFKSSDAGENWVCISDNGPGTNLSYRDADIGTDQTYYVLSSNSEGLEGVVWKYTLNGIWTNITPSGTQPYEAIAVDPTNNQRVVVMKAGGKAWTSVNQGSTWTSQASFKLNSPSVEWLALQDTYWLSVGELRFDPFDSGKLWFAEGFGVWHTKDIADTQITWIEDSKGIEETCGNTVICPPGGKPVTAMWDIGAFYHSDPDSYNAKRAYNYFMSCWHLDWCASDPAFLVGTFQTHLSYNNTPKGSYSTNGGKTWQPFASLPTDLIYGCVAVSANNKNNIVWLPSNDKLPCHTTNMGASWQQPSSFAGLSTSGYNGYPSPRKPLCADRVLASTFYYYHTINGVYKSTDGGANWSKAGNSPVSNRYNSMMKTAPGHAGHLWLAEGKGASVVGGLWHSTDGGSSWTVLPGLQQAFSFGFGKPQIENGYPTIFVAGVANGQHGIYRSVDTGNSWTKIADYPLGIFDYVDDIDGDKDVFGKVYICFAGSGFAYGLENNSQTPVISTQVDDIKMITCDKGNLKFKNIIKKTKIKIYTITGSLIYSSEQNGDLSINLNQLGLFSGILLVNMNDGDKPTTKKIIL